MASSKSKEFLTTYGWAMIVIILLLITMAYFGLVNPNSIAPNKCEVPKGFSCSDYSINEDGGINFILKQKTSEDLRITSVQCISQEEFTITTKDSTVDGQKVVQPITWDSPKGFHCKFSDNPFAGKKGEPVNAWFKITVESQGVIKNIEGKIHIRVN